MNSKCQFYIKIMLSAIFSVLIQMDIDMNRLPRESFSGRSIVFEIFLFVIFYYSFKLWNNCKANYKIWSLVTASCLAIFYTLGYNLERYADIFTEYNQNWMIGKLFLKWIVYWYCFATIIMLFFLKFDHLKSLHLHSAIKNIPVTIRQIILMLILAICWLPYYIDNFPSILYGDSWCQLYQAVGIEQLTTHHPIIHTLFLKLCIHICNDIENGILFFTLISFTTIIIILAYIINLMIEESFDWRIIILAVLIYVFFPSIPMFAITITKDSWFAAFVGLFLIEIYITVINQKYTIGHLAGLFVSAIAVGLFRKNGIYLLIFSLVYSILSAFFFNRKQKKILMILIASIGINIGIEHMVPHVFDAGSGSPREMLSLPIQQMARIEKNVRNLDKQIKSEIDSFFIEDANLGEVYYPLISDNAKSLFSETKFRGREKEFVILSLRLLFMYPEESLEAFMCNSYGYWYPVAINWFFAENKSEPLDIKAVVERHEYPSNVDYIYFNEFKYNAGLDFFSSIGVIFWFFVIITGYLIANKKYSELLLMVPMGALWCTSIASPVWNELRYVLAIYLALPIICQLAIPHDPCSDV